MLTLNGNLRGTLPKDIENLKHLQIFDIGHNRFNETIPIEIMNIPELNTINMAGNQFSGTLPEFLIHNMTSLYILILGENLFTGTLPELKQNIGNLEQLQLNDNKVT